VGETGCEKEWLERVDVVEGGDEAEGVSSTRVREAVKREDWDEVRRLVGEGITEWVRARGLYLEESDKGRERL
jgi:nicotinamide-nucleotide adenylyltransferase